MTAGTAEVEFVPPQAVAAEFGEAAAEPAGRTDYMAVLAIRVRSLPAAVRCLSAVPALRVEPHRLIVPAAAAFNITLIFSA